MAAHGVIQTAISVAEAVGGVSGAVAVLTYWLKRREVREAAAEHMVTMAQSLSETALALLEPVQTAAAKAEQQVAALQQQVRDLERAVESLKDSLSALTVRSQVEREDLLRRLDEVTADRDRLAALVSANGSGGIQTAGPAVV